MSKIYRKTFTYDFGSVQLSIFGKVFGRKF